MMRFDPSGRYKPPQHKFLDSPDYAPTFLSSVLAFVGWFDAVWGRKARVAYGKVPDACAD